MRVNCENYQVHMGWIPFHEAAVKGHLEICQTIMWSLEISNFTNFHPRDDKGLTSLHQAAARNMSLDDS